MKPSTILRSLLKVIAVITGLLLALIVYILGYTLLRPILRAIGWLISLATFLLLAYFLYTKMAV